MIGQAWRRGLEEVAARPRLLAGLYLVQLVSAAVIWLSVAGAFGLVFGSRPIFAEAMAGDAASLVLALRAHSSLAMGLVCVGLAVAFAYFVMSLWLSAGLLGHYNGLSFGAEAGRRVGAFARLWGWSLLPYGAALGLLVAGWSAAGPSRYALSFAEYATGAARATLPALLLVWLTGCAVDLARADLVHGDHRSAWRAFFRGWRLMFTSPGPLATYGMYLALWLAVTALYLAGTVGREFPGLAGGLLLLFLRQAVLVARFLARATLSGAQLSLVAAGKRLATTTADARTR